LSALSLSEISRLLTHSKIRKKNQGWIIVDSVLGLPQWLQIPQGDLTREFAKAHRFKGRGKAGSEDFFGRYRVPLNAHSLRLCDRLAKAQSVFQTTPAQRNIQTGTFRIWQDLGADSSWYSLWPSSPQASKTLLIEGFPTLMWKQVFGFSSRKPALIQDVSDSRGIKLPELYSTSPDWADSAILALGALELLKRGNQINHDLPPQAQVEGWILGTPKLNLGAPFMHCLGYPDRA
jgi:hypothetical protein